MRTKNIVIGIITMGILIAVYMWFFVYNKAHVDYQASDALFIGQAEVLHDQAVADAAVFKETYVNQAVEVEGKVSEVGSSSFTLKPGLICTLDTNYLEDLPNTGDLVNVKGRVVGTDEDILTSEIICILDQCVILSK